MTAPNALGTGLRLHCDGAGCGRKYSPTPPHIMDGEAVRAKAAKAGWRIGSTGGDVCRDCGGGRRKKPPRNSGRYWEPRRTT